MTRHSDTERTGKGEREASYDVRVWGIKVYVRTKGRTYGVRWSVANRPQHSTFATRAIADSFRSDLLSATRQGIPFDIETGLPVTLLPEQATPSWYTHACAFVDSKWSRLRPAPASRSPMV